MYICVCYGITDKQLQTAMENGIDSCSALRREFGVGSQCGQCCGEIRQMVQTFKQDIQEKSLGIYLPVSA